jgi:hypothetical protein
MNFLATNLPALPDKSHGVLFWIGVALAGLIAAFAVKIINEVIVTDIKLRRDRRQQKTKHHDKEEGIY